jgi:hypothetical protein
MLADEPTPMPSLTPNTPEWGVQLFLGLAETGTGQCLEHLSTAVRHLVNDGDRKAALAATMEAHSAAMQTQSALGGVRACWTKVIDRLTTHPRTVFGGGATAVGLVVAAWLFWPAAAGATGAAQPTPVPAVENRVCDLIAAEQYFEAQRLIDTEMGDAPRGHYLRGELERMRGRVWQADMYLQKAADGGDSLAIKVLKARSGCTE